MVFNAAFNNILVISWRSVLLVEETGEPGETTYLSQVNVICGYLNETIYILIFILHMLYLRKHIALTG